MLRNTEAVIATVVKHSSAATCLDFCPSQQNLLVSGGTDGELVVCDMNDPSKKTVHSLDAASETLTAAVPGLGAGGAKGTQHPISSVAWNRRVGPILTAVSSSGLITIWDLRKKAAILSFTDNGRRAKWRSASWDPTEPTVLVTAADENENPVVLWDLRSIQLPRYFGGHKRGVWCTSWNSSDSSLLVTSGKDRTLCWNPATMEIRCEINTAAAAQLASPVVQPAANPFGGIGDTQEHWDMSALWSPTLPGTLALCSYGSAKPKISLVPLSDPSPAQLPLPLGAHDQQQQQQQQFALPPVPAWMKRPVGCAFGFGGKMAVFRSTSKTVELHKCDVDTALVERAERFRGATTSGGIEELCRKKAEEATTEEEKALWTMFASHYGANVRTDLLKLLGYDKDKINEELDAALKKADGQAEEEEKKKEEEVKEEDAEAKPEEKAPEEAASEEEKKTEEGSGYFDDAQANVFDSIAAQKPAVVPVAQASEAKEEEPKEEPVEVTVTGDDAVITQALLVGEYEKAARYCASVNRDADALVIASYGGRELFEKIRDAYCARVWMPAGMKFVHMLLNSPLEKLVARIAVDHWRAAMAALCTYASKDEFPVLACVLGDRLRDAKNTAAATLCYIASCNMGRVVSIWIAQQNASSAPARETLPDLIEKLIILKHATKASDDAFSVEALDKFVEYAELLSSQGAMLLAASYISFLAAPRFANTPAALFLERLRRSGDAPVSAPVAAAAPAAVAAAAAAAPRHAEPAKPTAASPFIMKPAVPVSSPVAPPMFRAQPDKPAVPTASPVAPRPAAVAAAVPSPAMFRPQMPAMVPAMPVAQPTFVPSAVPAAPVATPAATVAAPRPQLMTPTMVPTVPGTTVTAMSAAAARAPTQPMQPMPVQQMPMPMQGYGQAPTMAPSMARPKPERMTTSLAAELQHAKPADAAVVESITANVGALISALQQRAAGTADEPHVRDTNAKLQELLVKAAGLPCECAEAVAQFLQDVAAKDSAAATASLARLTKVHSKSLSASILTGLRFLQRLSAKLL